MSEQKLSDWLAEWWPFALSTHEIGNAAVMKTRALEAKLEAMEGDPLTKLIIRRVLDGYVVEDEDGQTTMFEDIPDQVDSAARLLWHLLDCSGMYGDRYDAKSIRITLEPDDKNEEEEAG